MLNLLGQLPLTTRQSQQGIDLPEWYKSAIAQIDCQNCPIKPQTKEESWVCQTPSFSLLLLCNGLSRHSKRGRRRNRCDVILVKTKPSLTTSECQTSLRHSKGGRSRSGIRRDVISVSNLHETFANLQSMYKPANIPAYIGPFCHHILSGEFVL